MKPYLIMTLFMLAGCRPHPEARLSNLNMHGEIIAVIGEWQINGRAVPVAVAINGVELNRVLIETINSSAYISKNERFDKLSPGLMQESWTVAYYENGIPKSVAISKAETLVDSTGFLYRTNNPGVVYFAISKILVDHHLIEPEPIDPFQKLVPSRN